MIKQRCKFCNCRIESANELAGLMTICPSCRNIITVARRARTTFLLALVGAVLGLVTIATIAIACTRQ